MESIVLLYICLASTVNIAGFVLVFSHVHYRGLILQIVLSWSALEPTIARETELLKALEIGAQATAFDVNDHGEVTYFKLLRQPNQKALQPVEVRSFAVDLASIVRALCW